MFNNIYMGDHSLEDTLFYVEAFSKKYCGDMYLFRNMKLKDFFNFVSKKIEYVPDPEHVERVCRPAITLKLGYGDCDDKTVVCLAFFILRDITCGYSITSNSRNKSYHHIFPFIIVKGKKLDFDATYAKNKMFQEKDYPKRIDKLIYQGAT